MGVYSLDMSSPKKAAAAGFHRGPFADLKRKLTNRRYLCLWVLVALVPCYLMRQMFFYQAPTGAARQGRKSMASDENNHFSSGKTMIPYEKPTEVKTLGQKAAEILLKPSSIKPALYDNIPPPMPKATDNYTRNSLKLKLKDNFEDDEDFGVPEDNDKIEEQSWRAPPSPLEKTSRR